MPEPCTAMVPQLAPPKQIFSISVLVALIVNGMSSELIAMSPPELLLLPRMEDTSVSVGRAVLLPETG